MGIGLFWLAIKGKDINEILEGFKDANYAWIGLSVVFMIASHIIRAMRWNLLIRTLNFKPQTITTFYAVMIGYFVNLAVPRLGEISRCGVLSKHDKVPVNSLFGTVIAERTFDVITLFVIILITIFAQFGFLSTFIKTNIILPLEQKFSGNAVFIIAGAIFLLIMAFAAFYLYRIFKRKVVEHTVAFTIKNIIDGFIKGILTIKCVENKKLFLFYSVLMWLMYYLTIYIAFFAMKATSGLQPIDALTVLVIGSIGVLVPTPGGIGAYQFFVSLSLTALCKSKYHEFAIDTSQAFSFANLIYFTQWIMMIIVGGFSWIMLFLSQKRIKNETT